MTKYICETCKYDFGSKKTNYMKHLQTKKKHHPPQHCKKQNNFFQRPSNK